MKSLFDIDNPVMQVLSKMADMMLINFLLIFCSIPIITIGPSVAAAYKAMQVLAFGDEIPVVRTFFKAFRDNFKQAFVVGLFFTLAIFSMLGNIFMVAMHFHGSMAKVMFVLVSILTVLVISVTSYMFPLIVRYENTLRQHLRNALLLAVWKLPRTIVMVVLNVLPFVLWMFLPSIFYSTMILWAVIACSFFIFLDCLLLKPVFLRLEKAQEKALAKQSAEDSSAPVEAIASGKDEEQAETSAVSDCADT